MSNNTQIEWTDYTWNFIAAYAGNIRGWFCTKRTKACANCYAEAINLRLGNGLTYTPNNLDKVEFRVMPDMLLAPLRWRKPRKVFVNSMTDFFHPDIPDWMRRIGFAVMMCRPKCWFQILTKQPEQMEKFFQENTVGDCFTEAQHRADDYPLLAASLRVRDSAMLGLKRLPDNWPLDNVALLVSVGEQADADAFIPYLLRTPAAIRGLSLEPLLGPVDLTRIDIGERCPQCNERITANAFSATAHCSCCVEGDEPIAWNTINWLILGGESGKKARQCNVEWIRSLVRQGQAAGVAVFVKQLGKGAYVPAPYGPIRHPKGGDWTEWPADLRVRQFPTLNSQLSTLNQV